ncbi:error-prone DNA polymerase [Gleimia sp. 6138-11-ORH1]|uniref:error-prone DNA polymerase n=1 Tax=Gleimia sp. 6138-11-ORH1 TaxID=2973937 RepID=UPI002169977E|nr:error-prone DNA polymerase [Gleimia sp. 6138-11-ORH1]MCS4484274.1 error-prone DNA polymerase [Gleimia sp. 6138-11-ORH1]
MSQYAELHAHSCYSFLYGADHPETLVKQAKELGLTGIAILDYHGMYGAVKTAVAAKTHEIKSIYGTEILVKDPDLGLVHLPVLANNVKGYHQLCKLISDTQLANTSRQDTILSWEEIATHFQDNWTILTGTTKGPLRKALNKTGITGGKQLLQKLTGLFGNALAIESNLQTPEEQELTSHQLATLAKQLQLPLIATGAVKAAHINSLPRANVLNAIHLKGTLEQTEPYLEAFPAILRSASEMEKIHKYYPQATENAAELAEKLAFNLNLIAPQLPKGIIPPNETEESWLRKCTYQGAYKRYGTPNENPKAWETIESELQIITQLGFCGYFLIVKEIVDFCLANDILCQGRGSAANSAVCYSLGITAVDAVKHQLMFARFLSPDRDGPPDIDIDIEAERREEVIQHVYEKYGRHNAAQVANVITYRTRYAISDVAKTFGYSEAIARSWSKQLTPIPIDPRVEKIAKQLRKFPRHLGVHTGGMVLTRQPVSEICPLQWASKTGRTILQWDKEDCAEVGLVKFDLLGLGMLTALKRMFTALEKMGHRGTDGKKLNLYNLPAEDPAVYDLLCAADTVGVFQVESRAQMNTLPRLKPRCFYDLVVEVALIRPGPIQGNAVNPYLRRRLGKEPITYIHPSLEPILQRTLGVPIFQEQLMQIAVETAGFTTAEADQLRKAISAKDSSEKLAKLKPKLFAGIAAKGISKENAETIFNYFKGYAQFGFPESHAFSFAYIVYASAWMKVHHRAEFYAALIASQPMGFYSVASLIADARRHNVKVHAVDVNSSQWLTKAENEEVYLGLHLLKGLGKNTAQRIVKAREKAPFTSLTEVAWRCQLNETHLRLLGLAGAFNSLGINRRDVLWQARFLTQNEKQPTLPGLEFSPVTLPEMTKPQEIQADYQLAQGSAQLHPFELLRTDLTNRGIMSCAAGKQAADKQRIKVAGLVTHRQRPATAKGVVFLALEDETGIINVRCSIGLWKRYRLTALNTNALIIRGVADTADNAFLLVADKIEKCEVNVQTQSRDFR